MTQPTISHVSLALDLSDADPRAFYRLFSHAGVDDDTLRGCLVQQTLAQLPAEDSYVLVLDVVQVPGTGRRMPGTGRFTYPQAPPWKPGIPLSRANRQGITLWVVSLDGIVRARSASTDAPPQHLCQDAVYDNATIREQGAARGYTATTHSRDEECQMTIRVPTGPRVALRREAPAQVAQSVAPADLTEIVWLNGLRQRMEQGYRQVKGALGRPPARGGAGGRGRALWGNEGPDPEVDSTYYHPLYERTGGAVGCAPRNVTADAAFDAWHIYQTCATSGGIAATPRRSAILTARSSVPEAGP